VDPEKAWHPERLTSLRRLGHWSYDMGPLAFSPDGRWLAATGGDDATIRIWNLANRTCNFLLGGRKVPPSPQGIINVREGVSALAFSPDGKTLFSGHDQRTIRSWDTASWEEIALTSLRSGEDVDCLALSPDGNFLASGTSKSATVTLLNPRTLDVTSTTEGQNALSSVSDLAFSPDGRILAAASSDTTVALWNITTKQPPVVCRGHTHRVRCVAFSPDGKSLASGAESYMESSVIIWEVATGKRLATLPGQAGGVSCLRYSCCGKYLLAANGGNGYPGYLKVWSTQSFQLLLNIYCHDSAIWFVALSPDETLLATSGGYDGIRLWDYPTILKKVKDAEAQTAAAP
jgi:WD40 repeat protein